MKIKISALRQIIQCDFDNGELQWLARPVEMFPSDYACRSWNTRYAGKRVHKKLATSGHHQITIFRKAWMFHRVIWALAHGEWPEGEIDHINGNPADNRIVNLRCIEKPDNQRNQGLSAANTSGAIGVTWNRNAKAWHAQIKFRGRKHHLGYFAAFDEAVTARRAAESRLGFHPNHGMRPSFSLQKKAKDAEKCA